MLTAILAFLAGGLVVLATGHSPVKVYQGIWDGTGLEWFFQVGSHEVGLPFSDAKVWFPWNVNDFDSIAATNLQQTLILWTTLVLTGLAVAFAFRCGLFNIGGQGQYFVGAYFAIWIGSSFGEMNSFVHITFAIVAAALAGAAWAGIAGILKATVGAHEVITTIMLNWIAYYVGLYLFGQGGPLQNTEQAFSPTSNFVTEGAKLPVFWGDPVLQGLHIGMFIALAALVSFWIIINRTTLGYEVRAVGFNPEAARYGGISVARQLLPRDGHLGHRSPGSQERSTCSAGASPSGSRTSSPRPLASWASQSRSSVVTPRSAWPSRRSCSGRC